MQTPSEPRTPYFQTDFPASDFVARRAKVMDKIGTGVALLRGSPASGAFDAFRQNNEFYYLCGVEVPVSYLLIDGKRRTTTLYLPPLDLKNEQSEGAQLSADDIDLTRRLTGAQSVRPLEGLTPDINGAAIVYLPMSPVEGRQACRDTLMYARRINAADPLGPVSPEQWMRERVQTIAPAAEIRDLSPILDELRSIKSAGEIELMAQAGKLSALAVKRAMGFTRPGVMEYELAAQAELVYLLNGARGGGYRPISAAGANIWNAHYFRNNCVLNDGDLVLLDYAPDCGNYTSDIGRMWPVNGVYSPLQRELYGFVVEFHKILLQHIRPGLTTSEVLANAARQAKPLLDGWKWSKSIYREAAGRLLQFAGSLSHPVGMAVHDAGDYRSRPLSPGVVFALDPQMWVPEERLYIRVEDTVAVTDTGVRNLTSLAPLELDDVEREMRANVSGPLAPVPGG